MNWLLTHHVHGDRPWDVQAEALRRSEGRDRYGFHLEQGLGKSALVFNEFLDSGLPLMLVTAPQSFKGDWPLVPAEWGHPEVWSGMWPRQSLPASFDKAVYAVNYEAVRSSTGDQLSALMRRYPTMLVIDESSAIMNPQSQTSRAVFELSKDAAMVRVLNGTPLVKNCMDLFMPLKCLGQLDKMNPYHYRNRFARMGGYMGRQIRGLNEERKDEFFRLLDSCAFRALKSDWRKDLPPKLFIPVHLEMTDRQLKHYREMLNEFYTMVADMEVSADMVLVQMDKLRQISSCLVMQDGASQMFEEPLRNPKMRATLDLIQSGMTKVIVVHTYKATGLMLMAELTRAGLEPACIRGGMKPEEVTEQKRRFNQDPACRVLVGQEAATARGHTLIGGKDADRCNRMIFFENSFSLMERLQIEDRIHRGEQDQDCIYWDLVTSPVEEAVAEALRNKKELADMVDAAVKAVRGSFNA